MRSVRSSNRSTLHLGLKLCLPVTGCDQFLDETVERASDEPALIVDVEGFEGPLDLLLTLARQQKVDLTRISILALADQYLAFIEAARKLRLELAADYLVMAAWLAFLKSRLLLPEGTEGEGASAADMATALALRLKRLEAVRAAASKLMERPQLNRVTAHVMFTAIDPDLPATLSPKVINDVIRGSIGFVGALMSDDVSMGALTGGVAERTRQALAAGCDIALHCDGDLREMEEVASGARELSGAAARRAERALAARRKADAVDITEARITFSCMMGTTAAAG